KTVNYSTQDLTRTVRYVAGTLALVLLISSPFAFSHRSQEVFLFNWSLTYFVCICFLTICIVTSLGAFYMPSRVVPILTRFLPLVGYPVIISLMLSAFIPSIPIAEALSLVTYAVILFLASGSRQWLRLLAGFLGLIGTLLLSIHIGELLEPFKRPP